MLKINKIAVTVSLLFSGFQCFAQQSKELEIVTDRPDLTESSRAVPHKSIQLETGVLMFVEEPLNIAEHKTTLYQLPATLVRIGLFKNIEFKGISISL